MLDGRWQWRFMFASAHPDIVGVQWRNEPPTQEEVAEWDEDFRPGAVWVERRWVTEGAPTRVEVSTLPVSTGTESSA
jgi:hypothetical protein